jgi:hypothetical protein
VLLSNKLRAAHTALSDGCAHHHAIGVFVVTRPMLAQFALSSLRKESYRLLSSCADGFPGIIDNALARECARSIAGWTPLPAQPHPVTRLRPRKDRVDSVRRRRLMPSGIESAADRLRTHGIPVIDGPCRRRISDGHAASEGNWMMPMATSVRSGLNRFRHERRAEDFELGRV